MIVNIDDAVSAALGDPHALPCDTTIWWCTTTSKALGPDDEPCHDGKCVKGRACFEAEDALDVA
jgi:hypothetical protein